MRTIPVMEVRRHLGELLDEVRIKSESFILERAGKPIATLCPLWHKDSNDEKQTQKLRALQDLKGLGEATKRSDDIDSWLKQERENW